MSAHTPGPWGAPDLLAALEAMVGLCAPCEHDTPLDRETFALARAAIAKAKGAAMSDIIVRTLSTGREIEIESEHDQCGWLAIDKRNWEPGAPVGWGDTEDLAIADLIDDLEEKEARAARRSIPKTAEEKLIAALRPFVEAYVKHEDPIGDSDLYDEQPQHVTVTLGDCRRARALLREIER